jgi:hypothetical protein
MDQIDKMIMHEQGELSDDDTVALFQELMDQIDKMIAYEQGELSDDDTVVLFQELIDSGLVWRLQGSYGRMAATLLEHGLCHEARHTVH